MSDMDAAETPACRLECMEIWGGCQAADNAATVTDIDCGVISEPYEGDASGVDVHCVSTCGGG